MKLLLLSILSVAATFFIMGCTQQINSFEECAVAGYPVMESYPRQCATPDGRTFVEGVGLANPASTYCLDQGYELDIRDMEEGQVGYCIGNGKECEEWAYYRGECSLLPD